MKSRLHLNRAPRLELATAFPPLYFAPICGARSPKTIPAIYWNGNQVGVCRRCAAIYQREVELRKAKETPT